MTIKIVGNELHFEGYIVGNIFEPGVVPYTVHDRLHKAIAELPTNYDRGYKDGVADAKAGIFE